MSDMREDFEAAIESEGLESEDKNALQETQQVVEEYQVPSEESPDQAQGKDPSEAVDEPTTEDKPDTNDKIGQKETVAEKADDNNSIKAPVDWSPKQRESWSKIPRPIQDKIVAREQEMAQAMQGTGEARKTHDQFSQLAQAYAPIIASEGASSPMQAVEGMFKAVAHLRMGSPADKAQQIAGMIKHYGVDIQTLDDVLVGQTPQARPNAEMEQMLDQRMAPINQVMQQLSQMQANKQQQTQQAAVGSVQEFSKNAEFLGDVRMDMADLIDMAAKQGRTLTLQDAYDRACTLNPEISNVLDQRKEKERIMGSNSSIANKRNAASTLNGRQSGGGGAMNGLSLRDTIASAWDDAG
jgi:hypothetical protein